MSTESRSNTENDATLINYLCKLLTPSAVHVAFSEAHVAFSEVASWLKQEAMKTFGIAVCGSASFRCSGPIRSSACSANRS
jgi:hypothetical protein